MGDEKSERGRSEMIEIVLRERERCLDLLLYFRVF